MKQKRKQSLSIKELDTRFGSGQKIEGIDIAKLVMKNKIEASVKEINRANQLSRQYGLETNEMFQGDIRFANSRHLVSVVADENLKNAPLDKLELIADKKRNSIESSLQSSVAIINRGISERSNTLKNRGGRLKKENDSYLSRENLKNDVERIESEINRRRSIGYRQITSD